MSESRLRKPWKFDSGSLTFERGFWRTTEEKHTSTETIALILLCACWKVFGPQVIQTRYQVMRILIVEDEGKTGLYLRKGLTEAGYVADWVEDGISGQHQAETEDYDLLIVDVMLPGQDGWTLLHNLRRSKSTPVLFLTARDDVGDRIRGLELGADDAKALDGGNDRDGRRQHRVREEQSGREEGADHEPSLGGSRSQAPP